MHKSPGSLPPSVVEALSQGNPLEAIKRLRAAAGISLTAAKERVDAHQLRGAAGPPGAAAARFNAPEPPLKAATDQLPPAVVIALQNGNKIQAIRLLREQTGLGLKEAYDRIEAASAAGHGAATGGEGLAPGEVPRSRVPVGWIVVALVIIGIAYFYLRRI